MISEIKNNEDDIRPRQDSSGYDVIIMNALLGNSVTEKRLHEELEKANGNILMVMKSLVANMDSLHRVNWVKKYPKTKKKRSLENMARHLIITLKFLQSLYYTNNLSKEKILQYACMYAKLKQEELFVDILERYIKEGEISVGTKFEFAQSEVLKKKNTHIYKYINRYLLSHLVHPHSANNLKCARYLLESEMVSPNDEQVLEALELTALYSNEHGKKLLLSRKYLDVNDKTTRDYALNYMKQRNNVELFEEYLKTTIGNTKTYELVMTSLCNAMEKVIQNRKRMCSDIFNLCWLFDKPRMWKAIYKQCKQLLDAKHLSSNCNTWHWVEDH
ncbi:hypothetical protein RFI_00471, partial [Reticulomyxa filosa]